MRWCFDREQGAGRKEQGTEFKFKIIITSEARGFVTCYRK